MANTGWTSSQEIKGLTGQAFVRRSLWQVICTCVPLPSSSVIWHWAKGGDALWLRR